METDFQMLLLEKTLLEKEIQRMREPEVGAHEWWKCRTQEDLVP